MVTLPSRYKETSLDPESLLCVCLFRLLYRKKAYIIFYLSTNGRIKPEVCYILPQRRTGLLLVIKMADLLTAPPTGGAGAASADVLKPEALAGGLDALAPAASAAAADAPAGSAEGRERVGSLAAAFDPLAASPSKATAAAAEVPPSASKALALADLYSAAPAAEAASSARPTVSAPLAVEKPAEQSLDEMLAEFGSK